MFSLMVLSTRIQGKRKKVINILRSITSQLVKIIQYIVLMYTYLLGSSYVTVHQYGMHVFIIVGLQVTQLFCVSFQFLFL